MALRLVLLIHVHAVQVHAPPARYALNSRTSVFWMPAALQIASRLLPADPPKGESQSSGRIGRMVRSVRDLARTVKDDLEEAFGGELLKDHPALPWLVRWAGQILTRYIVHSEDGRTSGERLHQKRYDVPVVCFGEKVLYREFKGSSQKDKFKSKWHYRFWMGLAGRSLKSVIVTEHGMVRTRAIRRLVEEKTWDFQGIMKFQGNLQSQIPASQGILFQLASTYRAGPSTRKIRRRHWKGGSNPDTSTCEKKTSSSMAGLKVVMDAKQALQA